MVTKMYDEIWFLRETPRNFRPANFYIKKTGDKIDWNKFDTANLQKCTTKDTTLLHWGFYKNDFE